MHAPLKHKRIIAIWFIVTWPKVSRMSDLVNIDHPHHKSINYNWKHSKRIEWLRETELQHTKSCQATNSYTKWGKMTDPVLGNLWYFQLCRSNNVTAQYIELDLTWMWVGAEKLELHVRYLHSSRLSAFLARRPNYKGMREAAARIGQACCPGCCWAGEHVSRWDDGTQATTMACPKAWVQHGPMAISPLWGVPGTAGSALLSWSGKYSRLKHGVKTQVWAVTYVSFLAIMVFSTTNRYFILSC